MEITARWKHEIKQNIKQYTTHTHTAPWNGQIRAFWGECVRLHSDEFPHIWTLFIYIGWTVAFPIPFSSSKRPNEIINKTKPRFHSIHKSTHTHTHKTFLEIFNCLVRLGLFVSISFGILMKFEAFSPFYWSCSLYLFLRNFFLIIGVY